MKKVTKRARVGGVRELAVSLISVGIFCFGAVFAAVPNEGGEYTFSTSYGNDMRTTGQTGDQIWNIASPVTIGSFYPGQTDIVPYWQIYTGAAITAKGNDRFMMGNIAFENAVIWTGNNGYIGYTGPTKLVLRNGGSLLTKTAPIRIGNSYNSGTTGYATVFMEEPSYLTSITNRIYVGYNLSGALWMDGGIMSITNDVLIVGYSQNGPGYIRLNGGEISLRSEQKDAALIGNSAAYSSVHVSGGKLVTRRTGVFGEVYFTVANNAANKAADFYVDGGLVDFWNERFGLGYWGNGADASGARATLTVDGDGRFRCNLPVMGRNGNNGLVAININGGRFELTRGLADYGNTGNRRYLNFDGGTLALVRDSRTTGDTGSLGNVAQNVIYPGGATIEVPSGIGASVSGTFRAAEGYGVSDITLTSAGSGYVTAPEVKLTGGVGSNATAYAVLNKDRTLEKIVVTCRGEGYAANDEVAVTIVSATGSGAAATATLAPNAGGVIHKTGAGAWIQKANVTYDMDVEVKEGSYILNGVSVASTATFRMGETGLRPSNGMTSSLDRLDAQNGIVSIRDDLKPDNGTAILNLGVLTVTNGLALVTHTNAFVLTLAATDLTATSSAESPVVNGMVYANLDASAYRSPSLFERAADGSLTLVKDSTTLGVDANWIPSNISEANAPEVSAVNSIILPLGSIVQAYVKNTGLVEVKSGMILYRRPQADVQRVQVTGGGAFTTRAKGGMFIYGDNKEVSKRSHSRANGDEVNYGNWRRLFGPFADPDANTPMALTVAGVKESRPELGVQAWLLGTQRFSGGLNLVNGGVFIQADSGLGASGSPVRASGYCSITSYNWNFAISHPIELLDGSALIFSPVYGNSGNTVSSTFSGSGDLLTSDVNRSGYAMEFTGDHSAFTGDYYIQGHARIAPATFSPLAGICLADGTNGVGVIETSGTFTRPAGTGKGEICWKRFASYPSNYGLRGGFAAKGGDLTVNLGGAGAKLVVGADYLPEGAVIQLQSQYADGTLSFANGFELGGKTQAVSVRSGKEATFAGALSDAVGGGALAVTGNLALDGATLEVGAANLSAPMLAVNGALTLAGTLNLALGVTNEELADNGEVTLANATGGVSGTFATAGNVPAGWTVLARANSLVLKKLGGTVITVK